MRRVLMVADRREVALNAYVTVCIGSGDGMFLRVDATLAEASPLVDATRDSPRRGVLASRLREPEEAVISVTSPDRNTYWDRGSFSSVRQLFDAALFDAA